MHAEIGKGNLSKEEQVRGVRHCTSTATATTTTTTTYYKRVYDMSMSNYQASQRATHDSEIYNFHKINSSVQKPHFDQCPNKP